MRHIFKSTQATLMGMMGSADVKPARGSKVKTQAYHSDAMIEYSRESNLQGRGQAGVAGFYSTGNPPDLNKQFLIKVDDAATCFFEGTARFAESVIPDSLKRCVNFANAGRAIIDNEGGEITVSIQPKVNDIESWAEVITGKKRNPKTLVSFEASNADKILASIDSMTDQAKDELAMAICVSTMVGDESLHVGQFVVQTDEKTGAITHVTRIDFGARERYAVKRNEENDFKYSTSDAYKHSGQLGKDYVSYLLAHPEINARVMHFWNMQMVNADALKEEYRQQIGIQFNNLPVNQRQSVLDDVASVVNKGAKNPVEYKSEEIFANNMCEIMGNRVNGLKQQANDNISLSIGSILDKVQRHSSTKDTMRDVIKDLANAKNMKDMIEKYNEVKDDLGKLRPPELAIKLLTHLQAKLQCCLYENPERKDHIQPVITQLKDLKVKYQVLNELQQYRSHLNRAALNSDKKTAVNKVIEEIELDLNKPVNDRGNMNDIVNQKFKDVISEKRFRGGSMEVTGKKLADRLDRVLLGYTPPESVSVPSHVTPPPLPPRRQRSR